MFVDLLEADDPMHARVAYLRAELDALEAEVLRLLRAQQIGPCKCGTMYQWSDLTLVQPMWYESPHGCMGGDQWHYSKRMELHPPEPCCNMYWTMNEDDQRRFMRRELFGAYKERFDE